MNNQQFRFPAEWEPCNKVLLAWPHENTDWAYMLEDVRRCFVEIASAVSHHATALIVAPNPTEVREYFDENNIDLSNIEISEIPTNDTWARDFGPISLLDERTGSVAYLDFKFNGWGLKFSADKDNLITSLLYDNHAIEGQYVNCLSFVLEGGSIETDGKGLLLTTSHCLLSRNRNGGMSRKEINDYLSERLCVEKILWLDFGYLEGDDTDSHIDTLARIAPNDTIIYTKCDCIGDPHYEELKKMEQQLKTFTTLDGRPFNLIGLPLPDSVVADGERLPATYANYLVVNDAILLPVYGQHANDLIARQMMKIAFPEHEIIGIDCRALVKQHGSLHCMTMQIPNASRRDLHRN